MASTPAVLRLLLDYGAPVDVKDEKGRTPLHSWCYKGEERGGSVALLKALLDSGADVNAQAKAGHTPLHYAAMYGRDEFLNLLLSRGAQLEARKYGDGYTPLMDAVRCRNSTTAEILLQYGANYSAKTFRQETILHLCAKDGDVAMIHVLKKANICGLDIDSRDAHDMTAEDHFTARRAKTLEIGDGMEDLFRCIRQRQVAEVDETEEVE